MPKNFCPICQKEFEDILKHFSLKHDFENMDVLAQEIQKAETKRKKQEAFREFILNLNNKLKNKDISIEEWRDLRDTWQFE